MFLFVSETQLQKIIPILVFYGLFRLLKVFRNGSPSLIKVYRYLIFEKII